MQSERPLHEQVTELFNQHWRDAVAKFRERQVDSVTIEFGAFEASLYDLKNNDDRETVRMPLDDLGKLLALAHMNGAGLAMHAAAKSVSAMAGQRLADLEGDADE